MIDAASLRLWQLISPSLPIGAYAYSQGQEYAVNAGWIDDEASALNWIGGVAQHSIAMLDVPVLQRMVTAWCNHDELELKRWSQFLLASRETSEIRAEDKHLGKALAKVLCDHGIEAASAWRFSAEINYPVMFSLAASHWQIPMQQTLAGYLWAWCENQTAAAIKLVPLGQTAGQRIMSQCLEQISNWVERAMMVKDEDIGVLCPGLAIASAQHETQYSRLFRS